MSRGKNAENELYTVITVSLELERGKHLYSGCLVSAVTMIECYTLLRVGSWSIDTWCVCS